MRTIKHFSMALLLLSSLFLTACNSSSSSHEKVIGNGSISTQSRKIADVRHIRIAGAYQLNVVQGKNDSLKITADSNILPLVITKKNSHTLSIYNDKSFDTQHPVRIDLVIKQLNEVDSSGANRLKLDNIQSNSLKIEIAGASVLSLSNLSGADLQMMAVGASTAVLSGKTNTLKLSVVGSGEVDAGKLKAKSVTVSVVGSGEARVNATEQLDVNIAGSGSLAYFGNPQRLKQSIHGAGSLKKLE